MRPWNLGLRFGLELAALAGLAWGSWSRTQGAARLAAIALPVAAAVIWGIFNVPNDPSRSGAAPVRVHGWIRLALEWLVLGGGWMGFAFANQPALAVGLAVLTIVHYVVSLGSVRWLVS